MTVAVWPEPLAAALAVVVKVRLVAEEIDWIWYGVAVGSAENTNHWPTDRAVLNDVPVPVTVAEPVVTVTVPARTVWSRAEVVAEPARVAGSQRDRGVAGDRADLVLRLWSGRCRTSGTRRRRSSC